MEKVCADEPTEHPRSDQVTIRLSHPPASTRRAHLPSAAAVRRPVRVVNAAFLRAILDGRDVYHSSRLLAVRLLVDGMDEPTVIAVLRALLETHPRDALVDGGPYTIAQTIRDLPQLVRVSAIDARAVLRRRRRDGRAA